MNEILSKRKNVKITLQNPRHCKFNPYVKNWVETDKNLKIINDNEKTLARCSSNLSRQVGNIFSNEVIRDEAINYVKRIKTPIKKIFSQKSEKLFNAPRKKENAINYKMKVTSCVLIQKWYRGYLFRRTHYFQRQRKEQIIYNSRPLENERSCEWSFEKEAYIKFSPKNYAKVTNIFPSKRIESHYLSINSDYGKQIKQRAIFPIKNEFYTKKILVNYEFEKASINLIQFCIRRYLLRKVKDDAFIYENNNSFASYQSINSIENNNYNRQTGGKGTCYRKKSIDYARKSYGNNTNTYGGNTMPSTYNDKTNKIQYKYTPKTFNQNSTFSISKRVKMDKYIFDINITQKNEDDNSEKRKEYYDIRYSYKPPKKIIPKINIPKYPIKKKEIISSRKESFEDINTVSSHNEQPPSSSPRIYKRHSMSHSSSIGEPKEINITNTNKEEFVDKLYENLCIIVRYDDFIVIETKEVFYYIYKDKRKVIKERRERKTKRGKKIIVLDSSLWSILTEKNKYNNSKRFDELIKKLYINLNKEIEPRCCFYENDVRAKKMRRKKFISVDNYNEREYNETYKQYKKRNYKYRICSCKDIQNCKDNAQNIFEGKSGKIDIQNYYDNKDYYNERNVVPIKPPLRSSRKISNQNKEYLYEKSLPYSSEVIMKDNYNWSISKSLFRYFVNETFEKENINLYVNDEAVKSPTQGGKEKNIIDNITKKEIINRRCYNKSPIRTIREEKGNLVLKKGKKYFNIEKYEEDDYNNQEDILSFKPTKNEITINNDNISEQNEFLILFCTNQNALGDNRCIVINRTKALNVYFMNQSNSKEIQLYIHNNHHKVIKLLLKEFTYIKNTNNEEIIPPLKQKISLLFDNTIIHNKNKNEISKLLFNEKLNEHLLFDELNKKGSFNIIEPPQQPRKKLSYFENTNKQNNVMYESPLCSLSIIQRNSYDNNNKLQLNKYYINEVGKEDEILFDVMLTIKPMYNDKKISPKKKQNEIIKDAEKIRNKKSLQQIPIERILEETLLAPIENEDINNSLRYSAKTTQPNSNITKILHNSDNDNTKERKEIKIDTTNEITDFSIVNNDDIKEEINKRFGKINKDEIGKESPYKNHQEKKLRLNTDRKISKISLNEISPVPSSYSYMTAPRHSMLNKNINRNFFVDHRNEKPEIINNNKAHMKKKNNDIVNMNLIEANEKYNEGNICNINNVVINDISSDKLQQVPKDNHYHSKTISRYISFDNTEDNNEYNINQNIENKKPKKNKEEIQIIINKYIEEAINKLANVFLQKEFELFINNINQNNKKENIICKNENPIIEKELSLNNISIHINKPSSYIDVINNNSCITMKLLQYNHECHYDINNSYLLTRNLLNCLNKNYHFKLVNENENMIQNLSSNTSNKPYLPIKQISNDNIKENFEYVHPINMIHLISEANNHTKNERISKLYINETQKENVNLLQYNKILCNKPINKDENDIINDNCMINQESFIFIKSNKANTEIIADNSNKKEGVKAFDKYLIENNSKEENVSITSDNNSMNKPNKLYRQVENKNKPTLSKGENLRNIFIEFLINSNHKVINKKLELFLSRCISENASEDSTFIQNSIVNFPQIKPCSSINEIKNNNSESNKLRIKNEHCISNIQSKNKKNKQKHYLNNLIIDSNDKEENLNINKESNCRTPNKEFDVINNDKIKQCHIEKLVPPRQEAENIINQYYDTANDSRNNSLLNKKLRSLFIEKKDNKSDLPINQKEEIVIENSNETNFDSANTNLNKNNAKPLGKVNNPTIIINKNKEEQYEKDERILQQNICMNEHYVKDKNYIFISTINQIEGKCYNFSEDNSNQPITDKIEISNINQIDYINNILPQYISFWINTNNEENGFIYKKALKHCLLLSPREKEEFIISSIIFTNAHKPSLKKSSEVNNKNELSRSLPTISVPLTSSCKDKAMSYPKRTNKLYSSSNITESPLSIDDFVIRANNIKVICNKPSNESIFISNKNEIEDDVVNTCEYNTNFHSHFLGRDKQALLSKKAVKDNHIITEKEKEEKLNSSSYSNQPPYKESSPMKNYNVLSQSLPSLSLSPSFNIKTQNSKYPKSTNKLYSLSQVVESPLLFDKTNNIQKQGNKPTDKIIEIPNQNEIVQNYQNKLLSVIAFSPIKENNKDRIISKTTNKQYQKLHDLEKEEALISSLLFSNSKQPPIKDFNEINNSKNISRSLSLPSEPLLSCKCRIKHESSLHSKSTNKLYSSSQLIESPLLNSTSNINIMGKNKPCNEEIIIKNSNKIEKILSNNANGYSLCPYSIPNQLNKHIPSKAIKNNQFLFSQKEDNESNLLLLSSCNSIRPSQKNSSLIVNVNESSQSCKKKSFTFCTCLIKIQASPYLKQTQKLYSSSQLTEPSLILHNTIHQNQPLKNIITIENKIPLSSLSQSKEPSFIWSFKIPNKENNTLRYISNHNKILRYKVIFSREEKENNENVLKQNTIVYRPFKKVRPMYNVLPIEISQRINISRCTNIYSKLKNNNSNKQGSKIEKEMDKYIDIRESGKEDILSKKLNNKIYNTETKPRKINAVVKNENKEDNITKLNQESNSTNIITDKPQSNTKINIIDIKDKEHNENLNNETPSNQPNKKKKKIIKKKVVIKKQAKPNQQSIEALRAEYQNTNLIVRSDTMQLSDSNEDEIKYSSSSLLNSSINII